MGSLILLPRSLCETQSGNLAHVVGRLVFQPGRPMLVEHVGGLYLEHRLTGEVATPGYTACFNIVHVLEDT